MNLDEFIFPLLIVVAIEIFFFSIVILKVLHDNKPNETKYEVGEVKSVTVFNKALSEEEIKRSYEDKEYHWIKLPKDAKKVIVEVKR